MRYRILYAGLLASVAAGAGAAVAADMPVRAAPAVAPIATAQPYVNEWAGFYVGIHGGGGWGHTSFDPSFFFNGAPDDPLVPRSNASSSGGVFGFQFGHNWQWGPVVGGLEIDFSGASIKATDNFFDASEPTTSFTREFKIDELASVRGRLGYLIFPNWLLYGTAGIGWAHTRETMSEVDHRFNEVETQTSFVNEFGWVAGAGLEWQFFPHWMLRGEWLHYDFGRNNHFDVVDFPVNTRTTVDVARAALSYKF